MPITEQQKAKAWQPLLSCLGKWDGEKGYLPTEEYLTDFDYQQAYFEGIKTRYLAQA